MNVKIDNSRLEYDLNLSEKCDLADRCKLAITEFYRNIDNPALYVDKTFRIKLNRAIQEGGEMDFIRIQFEDDNCGPIGIAKITGWRNA